MRRSILPAIGLVLCLSFACFAADSVEEQIKAKAKPVVQSFFDALMAQNYEGMGKDFTDKMKAAVPAKMLEEDDKNDIKKHGKIKSWEYTGWMQEDKYDIVLAVSLHEDGAKYQYKFVFDKGPKGTKIGGLWKKPVPKGLDQVKTDSYLAMFGPVAQRHLKAVKEKKYDEAVKDFSKKMAGALSAKGLQETIEKVGKGDLASWKFDFAEQSGEFISLYYKATFAGGVTLKYQFVFPADGKNKQIQGLWLK